VLLLKLLKFELFDDCLNLLVKFVIKIFILKGSLIQFLVQATLLDSSVGHVIQLSELHVVDGALCLSQNLGQSGRLDLRILDLSHCLLLNLTILELVAHRERLIKNSF
jgi:hypothetical protein